MLNSRELTLVLRARDEASRVLRSFRGSVSNLDRETAAAAQRSMARGQAMATAGIGLAAMGAGGVAMFNDMANAAMSYNQESAKTLTQVDGLNLSLGDIKKMGRDLAMSMPVDFKQVQGALYDIFSSIDVSAPQAQVLLKGIGRAAIAGATDMQTAGRGIIEVLNAYHMPATQVNKVNDIMFQLVRKGVGTYSQFSNTLGRSVPSAIKAGQSFQELAGGMAFLTRNGLSTAMASTALGRAFDALVKPKAQANLKELGVSVVDARGKFKPFSQIMEDLRKKLEKLTPAARAAKLDEIFKGSGGTVQAMRAFNHAINDGSGQLQQLTKDMYNSKGAAAEAYKVMANTPQAKIQQLNNRWQVTKTIVGDRILPIKMKLIEILTKLMGAFGKLNPNVQKFIIYGAMIASVLAIAVGVILVIVGSFVMLSGAAALAGTSIGAVFLGAIATSALVVVAIGAVAAAGYLVYKNWAQIKKGAIDAWNAVVAEMQPATKKIIEIKNEIVDLALWVYTKLKPYFIDAWNSIWQGIQNAWKQIQPTISTLMAAFTNLGTHFGNIVGNILTWINGPLKVGISIFKAMFTVALPIIGAAVEAIGQVVGIVFTSIGGIIAGLVKVVAGTINLIVALLTGNWSAAWNACKQIVSGTVQQVVAIFTGLLHSLNAIVSNIVSGVINFFKNLWNVLVGHSIVPDMINAIIKWFALLPIRLVAIVIKMQVAVIAKFISMAGQALVYAGKLVSNVAGKIGGLPGKVLGYIGNMMVNVGRKMQAMASDAGAKASQLVSKVVSFFQTLPGRAISSVSSLASKMGAQGRDWINSAITGVKTTGRSLISWFSNLPSVIKAAIPNPLGMLSGIGGNIIQGLVNGISAGAGKIGSIIKGITDHIPGFIRKHLGIGSPSKVMAEVGQWIPAGLAKGINDNSSNVSKSVIQMADAATKTLNKYNLNGTIASKLQSIAKYGPVQTTISGPVVSPFEGPARWTGPVRSPVMQNLIPLGQATGNEQEGYTFNIENFHVHVDQLQDLEDIKTFIQWIPMLIQMKKGSNR